MSKVSTGQKNEAYVTFKIVPYFWKKKALTAAMERNGCMQHVAGPGRNMNWQARLSAQALKSYGPYQTFTATERGDYTEFSLPWGHLYMDDQFSGMDKDQQGTVGSLKSGTLRKIGPQGRQELTEDMQFRFNHQMIHGDGTAVGAGGGVGLVGLKQFIPDAPATGTYANGNRATISDHRSQQIAGNAGPSSNWKLDAWERALSMQTTIEANGMSGKNMSHTPDIIICQTQPKIDIMNKYLVQNTSVGSEVAGFQSVSGMTFNVDTDLDASKVYFVTSSTVKYCWYGKKMFNLRAIDNIPNHVHEDDEALILRMDGQLKCDLPKANGLITLAV